MAEPVSKVGKFKSDPTREPDLHKVRIFGCSGCALLIFHFDNTVEVNCPYCEKAIDVFAEYTQVAFASGIFMSLFGTQIEHVIMERIGIVLNAMPDEEPDREPN